MSIGARVFVGVIFFIIGLSFIATTAALYYEFGYMSPGTDWLAIATFYSHLFLFFPVFGLLALAAFYVPCCTFTDMYWNHVPWGKLRFGVGFAIVTAVSFFGASALDKGDLRSIFEVKPEILAADPGDPPGECQPNSSCKRAPVLTALADVRHNSQTRAGMAKFVRNCKPDPLVERPPEDSQKRYCFVTRSLVDADTCCAAQREFGKAIAEMHKPLNARSLTVKVHQATLPMKIFFLLVVLVVGVLLAIRRRGISQHYGDWILKIERGVLVGAFSMLFLPVMNLAFLQSSSLLYGTEFDSLYRSISLPGTVLFAGWALLLLFFFFRDIDKDMETIGRIAGVVGSFLAVSNYDLIVNYFVRFAGSGADGLSLFLIGAVAFAAFIAIVVQPKGPRKEQTME